MKSTAITESHYSIDDWIEKRRQIIRESAVCVLKTLHEHGIEAVITGNMDIDFDIFIHGSAESHGGYECVCDLIEPISDWAESLLFEDEITEKVAELLSRRHMVWDKDTQTGMIRNRDAEP